MMDQMNRFREQREPSDASQKRVCLAWREEDEPESVVPDVSLTRSRDGSTGTATFRFARPRVLKFNDVWDNGLITGLYLRDEEGALQTTDLSIEFEGGRPMNMVCVLVLKNKDEWNRFMRFMKRYAEANEMAFAGAGDEE